MIEFILTIFFLVLDQGSKALADVMLHNLIVIIPNFFSLSLVYNKGASWSILENKILFLVLVGICSLFLLQTMRKTIPEGKLKVFAYSLLNAGIVGNLIDRICYQHVRDFLKFDIFGYSFPVFNFADIEIVIGTLFMIILIWKEEKYGKNNCRGRRERKIR